jgi:DNA-damage-inducible protein D
MEKQTVTKLKSTFDGIAHTTEEGVEYWLARELQNILGYSQWRRFAETIERAKIACKNSGYSVPDHFADAGKMVRPGHGAGRKLNIDSTPRGWYDEFSQ